MPFSAGAAALDRVSGAVFGPFLLVVFVVVASVSFPALPAAGWRGSFSLSLSPDEPLLRFLARMVVIDLEPNLPASTRPGVARGRRSRPGSFREL